MKKPTYQELEKKLEALQTTNNLIEKSPVVRFVWRNEKNWPVEFVSENVKTILGYTADDFYTLKAIYSKIIHPDDLQRVKNEVSEKSEANLNSFTHKPYRIICKYGRIKRINDITIIRRNENNEITHYEGVIVDITEQKEVEENLINSELRWKFAIEGNSDGLWDWNLLTNEVFFSEQWKNMLGFAKDEIKGSIEEWEKRVHPDDKKRVSDDINKHINGETDFYENEHRVLCKDNRYKWVLARGKITSYTSDKKPARMIGTHTDISERKNAEVIYETTVNSLNEPLHVIDKDYNIIFINKAFLDLLKELGLSQNVVGKKVYDAFNIPFNEIKKELEEVFSSGKKLVSEEVTEINGNKIYTTTTKTPIIENGKVEKIITTISNITEQKKHEQALIQRDTYITALNKATSLLLQDNSIPYQKFTEIIGKAANASRTYIFKNHKDKKGNVLMSQKAEYCAKGINPEINNPNLQNLSYDNFDRMRETLSKGKLYKGRIKDFPKNEKEFLEPQDIKTILIIPIIINKQFWGFIGFDNCINEQEWTLTEQKYLETAAKNLEQEIKRNNTQKQLKAENQRFQTTMDAIDAIVYVADIETYELLYLNKLGKELTGDNVGQKCYSALQRGLTEPCNFCTNHLLTDKNGNPKEPYVWEFQNTKTKQWYQCRDQVIPWIDGRLVRIEIATDISDRKQAEMALISEKKFSEKIIETSSAVIVGLDHKHIIRIFNKGAEKTTGYKKSEVMGKDWFKIFFPKEMLKEMNNTWKDAWGVLSHTYENPILTKTGNERIVSWQTTGIYEGRDITKHLIISIGEDITERKISEQVLREKESQLRQIIDLVPHFIFVKDETGKFEIVNKATAEVFGTTVEELTGMRDSDFVATEEEAENFRADDLEVLKSGKTKFIPEEPITDSENNIRYLQTTKVPFHFSATKKPSLLGVAVDITERKKAEQVLKQSKANVTAIIENTTESIWAINNAYEIIYVNAVFKIAFNESFDVMLEPGVNLLKSLPEALKPVWKLRYDRVLSNEQFSFIDKIDFENHSIHIEVFMNPIVVNNKVVGASFFGRDITVRMQIEKALKESENRFKTLSEATYEAIFISENGVVIEANFAACKITGYSYDELMGMHGTDFFAVDSKEQAHKNLKIDYTKPYEAIAINKNGKRIHVEVQGRNFNYKGIKARITAIRDITERKEHEKLLKESEYKHKHLSNQFRLMSDNIPDLVWAKDLEGKFTFVNKAVCEKLLIAENTEEPIGKIDMFFVMRQRNLYPERNDWHTFGEVCINSDEVVLKTKKPQRFDEYGNVNGEFLYLDAYKAPIFDDAGEMIGTVGHGRIVTKEKEIEKKLKESEGKFRSVVKSMSDIIFVLDTEHRFVSVYSNQQNLLFEPEMFIGKKHSEIMPKSIDDKYNNAIINVKKGKTEEYEYDLKIPDGIRWFSLKLSPILQNGNFAGSVAVVRDITHKKKDELLLQKQLNYISFTNKLSTGFINIESIEIDKAITELIKTTAQFTGVERAYVFLLSQDKKRLELSHEWCAENVLPHTGILDGVNVEDFKEFTNTLSRGDNVQLNTADLEPLPENKAMLDILNLLGIKSFINLPMLTGNNLIGYIGFDSTEKQTDWTTEMIDSYNLCKLIITNAIERNRAETELDKSKNELLTLNDELIDIVKIEVKKSREKDHMMMVQSRQAAMGEMIGSIAHQWRQPLNEIGLYIQNLQNKFLKDKLSPENLDVLVEKTMVKLEYMSHTIEDFRNFFRSDKEKKLFSLTESIEKTLTLTKSSFDNNFIRVISNLQEDLFLSGYPNEFSQAVLNILNNAKDVLTDREIENPNVEINLSKHNNKIILLISDNAGGISSEIIDKIFEPYFSTKSEKTGTGLGLHISKTIIERNMDGSLSVRNTKKGAEFKIEFKV